MPRGTREGQVTEAGDRDRHSSQPRRAEATASCLHPKPPPRPMLTLGGHSDPQRAGDSSSHPRTPELGSHHAHILAPPFVYTHTLLQECLRAGLRDEAIPKFLAYLL